MRLQYVERGTRKEYVFDGLHWDIASGRQGEIFRHLLSKVAESWLICDEPAYVQSASVTCVNPFENAEPLPEGDPLGERVPEGWFDAKK